MELFFWPFMLTSIVFSVIGITLKKPILLVVSAILIIPMSLYLSGYPLFNVWGMLFPLCYIGSAIAIKRNKVGLSIAVAVPIYLLVGWIGFSVLTH